MVNSLESLPRALFWDVDPVTLDPERHSRFIIERTLQFGRPEELRWMISGYAEAAIRETVRESRRIDRKTATFWALHYGIPAADVTCLREF